MKRIGIFGSTADPWTIAHQAIVEQVLEYGLVDEVHIIPNAVTYYRNRKTQWLSVPDRLRVIDAFCSQSRYSSKIFVWTNEVEKHANNTYRRFFDALVDFRSSIFAKDAELCLVLGTDSLAEFKTWYKWNEIADAVKIIAVLGRNDVTNVPNIGLAYRTVSISKDLANISASKIRAEYAGKCAADYLADVLEHKPTNYELYGTYEAALQQYTIIQQPKHARKADVPDFGKWLFMKAEEPAELLCHTPIFDVVKKLEVMPGFKPIAVKSPDWATVVVHKEGKLLMVNQLRYGTMKHYDEFPCGIVEPNETPRNAAKRELEEETGIAVSTGIGKDDAFQHLGSFAANPAFMTNQMHYFFVDLDKHCYKVQMQHLDEYECIDVLWKSKHDVIDDMLRSNCSSLMAAAMMLLMDKKLI